MRQQATPLLILTCASCGADMIRSVARGLLITNGAAIVADGFSQSCTACGHVHEAGTVIVMRMGRAAR